ncbi:hypothetical protein ACOAKC_01170 [Hathewaya histolytica]|uniref:hypothetical protein n=1 Tax=Hathewaya histolytica TaxID=1498 RepID=UPI003B6749F9
MELYGLRNPVKVKKVNKTITLFDTCEYEYKINEEHYLITFSNGYEMCITKEQFENMFEKDNSKIVRCQNCDAILAQKNGRETRIHLPKERVTFKEIKSGILITLKCH